MLRTLIKKMLYGLIGMLGALKPLMRKFGASHASTGVRHVAVVGDLYSESGLGVTTRALINSLDGQIDYSVINLPMSRKSRQGAYDYGHHETRKLKPGITIFVGNPSILLLACLRLNTWWLLRNKTIGVWFWELEKIPAVWVRAGRLVDEVWAQSAFVARAFAVAGRHVEVMPFVVVEEPVQRLPRAHFGLPEAPFVFLMTFDYLSHVARKNPMAVVRAFLAEFGNDTSVLLVIKSVNKAACPDAAAEVAKLIGASRNVMSIDHYLERDELLSLIALADCYVSLHRSEGLGLGMAEAMAVGTLVVATGYSGNMDFMNTSNGLLVDYALVPVAAAQYPFAAGNVWAEPSQASALEQMRLARAAGERTHQLIAQATRTMCQFTTANQQRWVLDSLERLS